MTKRLSNKAFAKLSAEHAANCQNCDWQGHIEDLDPIEDVSERVEEGDTVWAGDCPACGAMAFTVAEIERQEKLPNAARAMLAALERIVAQGYGLRNEAEAEKAIAQAKAAGIKA